MNIRRAAMYKLDLRRCVISRPIVTRTLTSVKHFHHNNRIDSDLYRRQVISPGSRLQSISLFLYKNLRPSHTNEQYIGLELQLVPRSGFQLQAGGTRLAGNRLPLSFRRYRHQVGSDRPSQRNRRICNRLERHMHHRVIVPVKVHGHSATGTEASESAALPGLRQGRKQGYLICDVAL